MRWMFTVLGALLLGVGLLACIPSEPPCPGNDCGRKPPPRFTVPRISNDVKSLPDVSAAAVPEPKEPTIAIAQSAEAMRQLGQRVGRPELAESFDMDSLPALGAPADEALVTVIVFADFQGPFSYKILPSLDRLRKRYSDELRLLFAQFPLDYHLDAEVAALASLEAQAQGKFWELHEQLFEHQTAQSRPEIETYAAEVDMDVEALRVALESDRHQATLEVHRAFATRYGIEHTPAVLVNGVLLHGAQPRLRYYGAVEAELARAQTWKRWTGLSGPELRDALFAHAPRPSRERQPPAPPDSRRFIDTAGAPLLGDPGAPIMIVAFTDFACTFCTRAASTLYRVLEDNPGDVKVAFMHHPLPLHPLAPLAHRASIAAHRQGKFWPYHDRLWKEQDALEREQLLGYAEELGLDRARFIRDMDDPATAARIEADIAKAQENGVRGSPHFFINGTRFSGAQPRSAFQDAITRELRIAKRFIKKGVAPEQVYAALVEQGDTPQHHLTLEGAPSRGPEDAIVTLVLFSDFQCPFCDSVVPTLETLFEAYPGRLRLYFKQLPLESHRHASLAAQAALAAHEQGQFWAFHDLLFANQRRLHRAELEGYAEQLGLDMERFREALDSERFAAQVEADIAEARSFGISGTPSFLINGEKFVGAQPIQRFREKIEEQIRQHASP